METTGFVCACCQTAIPVGVTYRSINVYDEALIKQQEKDTIVVSASNMVGVFCLDCAPSAAHVAAVIRQAFVSEEKH